MEEVLIYSSQRSNRLDYVISFINEQLEGARLHVTHALSDTGSKRVAIYGEPPTGLQNTCTIPAGDWLQEGYLTDSPPHFEKELTISENEVFNFDLFGAIFFLLSRAEEYVPSLEDNHGRYPSSASILSKKNLLDFPLIDHWLETFAYHLSGTFGLKVHLLKDYQFRSTIDVDHLYAYKHKPLSLYIGAFFRDLIKGQFRKLLHRFGEDPFYTFDKMFRKHDELGVQPLIFILCAARSKFDKSLPPEHKEFIYNVQRFSERYQIGIHPSYRTATDFEKLENEVKLLRSMVKEKINKSRQHYLRIKLPDTYRMLINLDIDEDYSMGYADQAGFRAGTSRPFNWYDIEKESITTLKIFPFQIMDVTLRNYMGLSPAEGIDQARSIIQSIRDIGGYCSVIWHNSSFYELEGWAGWEEVYFKILEEGIKK